MYPFDCTAFAGYGKVNHTSWVAVITPTDSPNSIYNRCVIEHLGDVFVLSLWFFKGDFVIGLILISVTFPCV